MIPSIILTSKEQELEHLVVITPKLSKLPSGLFSSAEKTYLKEQVETIKQDVVSFNRLGYWIYVYLIKDEKDQSKRMEASRKAGDKIAGLLNAQKATRVAVFDTTGQPEEVLAIAEGMALGSYQFLKYKSHKDNENTLKAVSYTHLTLPTKRIV